MVEVLADPLHLHQERVRIMHLANQNGQHFGRERPAAIVTARGAWRVTFAADKDSQSSARGGCLSPLRERDSVRWFPPSRRPTPSVCYLTLR